MDVGKYYYEKHLVLKDGEYKLSFIIIRDYNKILIFSFTLLLEFSINWSMSSPLKYHSCCLFHLP